MLKIRSQRGRSQLYKYRHHCPSNDWCVWRTGDGSVSVSVWDSVCAWIQYIPIPGYCCNFRSNINFVTWVDVITWPQTFSILMATCHLTVSFCDLWAPAKQSGSEQHGVKRRFDPTWDLGLSRWQRWRRHELGQCNVTLSQYLVQTDPLNYGFWVGFTMVACRRLNAITTNVPVVHQIYNYTSTLNPSVFIHLSVTPVSRIW